jgi:hypothetical protein
MKRNGRQITLAFCLLAISATVLAGEPPELEPVPGQLDVIEMTAVELDGRPHDGVEPIAYEWTIVEGEGGKLFSADRQDAVFLAPKVERGFREFVVELTVRYEDQDPSTRRLRIRVLPADAARALEGADGGDTGWLDDFYGDLKEKEESQQSSTPVVGGGRSGPSVSIGISGGSYGRRGGVGIRLSMTYPLSQPVDVPPPGQTQMPGEGPWGAAHPVPYEELDETFPASIAERYGPEDEPKTANEEPEQD